MVRFGSVTLPDGRVVLGRVVSTYEWDTNAVNVLSVDLEWKDGDLLTDDEYNEPIGDGYLHDFVTDALLLLKPEPEEIDWM